MPSPLSFPSPTVQTPPILMQQTSSMSMAPPPVPAQQGNNQGQAAKGTDTNVLADALASAGIDIKEEEAQLANLGNQSGAPTAASSFQSTVDGSFGPGYGQAGVDEAARLRRIAEIKANHANDPFLNARQLAMKVYEVSKNNKLGNAFVGGGVSPSVDVQTLISLAAKERIATLLTRAVAIGRQRRQANGIITGEWAPLVKGGQKTSPSRKRSHSETTSPIPGSTPEPVTTLPNETARALRLLAQKEYDAEKLRLDQKAAKAAVLSTGPATPGPSESVAGTPVPSGIDTPTSSIGDGPKKISAKEARKAASTKLEEEASHRAANRTAAVYFGRGFGLGKKKKTYSWMTGGSPAMSAPVGGRPPGGEEVGSPMEGVTPTGGSVFNAWGKRWGEWKEDGEGGKGVQLRDWVSALEGDGREHKGVIRGYLKLR